MRIQSSPFFQTVSTRAYHPVHHWTPVWRRCPCKGAVCTVLVLWLAVQVRASTTMEISQCSSDDMTPVYRVIYSAHHSLVMVRKHSPFQGCGTCPHISDDIVIADSSLLAWFTLQSTRQICDTRTKREETTAATLNLGRSSCFPVAVQTIA